MNSSTNKIDEMDFKLISYEMAGLDKKTYDIRSDSYQLALEIEEFTQSMLHSIESMADEIIDVRKMIKVIEKTLHKYDGIKNDETNLDDVKKEIIEVKLHRSSVIEEIIDELGSDYETTDDEKTDDETSDDDTEYLIEPTINIPPFEMSDLEPMDILKSRQFNMPKFGPIKMSFDIK